MLLWSAMAEQTSLRFKQDPPLVCPTSNRGGGCCLWYGCCNWCGWHPSMLESPHWNSSRESGSSVQVGRLCACRAPPRLCCAHLQLTCRLHHAGELPIGCQSEYYA